MARRIVEIVLPQGRADDIPELLHEQTFDEYWSNEISDNRARIRILLAASEVEIVFDILEPYLGNLPGSSAVLLNVEASIPRIRNNSSESGEESEAEGTGKTVRISRQELYNDIIASAGINSTYLAMVELSAVVAAIGLIRNDMAIIIGAMVIAPLLIPNVAMALANTLGDRELLMKGVKATGAGVLLAMATSMVIGYFVHVDPTIEAIAARSTAVKFSDLVLALASGAAGVLAFTSGGQLSLIGVMVAVALMPPLVTAGLLIGSGEPALGLKALELTLANVICVNLAGIVTFMVQGINPATWWEKSKASRARKRAIAVWTLMLVLLAYILLG
ncbi:MAG: TIGR00341 family protein [Deltaproteobacteria bacterium]|nr:TIGR00341 family protein [Deltaproteobacteria bacterium]